MSILALGIEAVERGLVPDALTRLAIRRMCAERLQDLSDETLEHRAQSQRRFVESMRSGEIALVPAKANLQHYELPPDFFGAVLGPRRKYSCCFWPRESMTLAEAETAALEATCSRAGIAEGQTILELGCGWGALSLWIAERYPSSRVTAVSNSSRQREYIDAEAAARGIANLNVVTADMNDFEPGSAHSAHGTFDRIVSIEMFEHMRNYERLLGRIASWLSPGGKLFVHVFCHRNFAYPFESEGTENWMGRYFFTGGMMPSVDLLAQFCHDLTITNRWVWNGNHYERTANAWLANLDSRRDEALAALSATYGHAPARRWLHRWRMFFLAVGELFGYAGGEEWHVAHYLLEPTTAR